MHYILLSRILINVKSAFSSFKVCLFLSIIITHKMNSFQTNIEIHIYVRCLASAQTSCNLSVLQIYLSLITNRNTVYLLLIPWSTHNCQCFWHHKLIRAVSMQIYAGKECSLTWVCLEQRNEYTLIHDCLWTQLKTPLARGQT